MLYLARKEIGHLFWLYDMTSCLWHQCLLPSYWDSNSSYCSAVYHSLAWRRGLSGHKDGSGCATSWICHVITWIICSIWILCFGQYSLSTISFKQTTCSWCSPKSQFWNHIGMLKQLNLVLLFGKWCQKHMSICYSSHHLQRLRCCQKHTHICYSWHHLQSLQSLLLFMTPSAEPCSKKCNILDLCISAKLKNNATR